MREVVTIPCVITREIEGVSFVDRKNLGNFCRVFVTYN